MDLPTQEVEVDRKTRSLTYSCEQGDCQARLRIHRGRIIPSDFSCPSLFERKNNRFYCTEKDIRSGQRKVSMCHAYLFLRTFLEERRQKKFTHLQGFTGTYADQLIPEGVDVL